MTPNAERAARAARILTLLEELYQNGLAEDNLTDALTDIRHVLPNQPRILDRAYLRSWEHFEAETGT